MRALLFIYTLLCSLNLCFGQTAELKKEIENIVRGKDLKLGFALYDFSSGKAISINGNDRFPMQSVFKFPVTKWRLTELENTLHKQEKVMEQVFKKSLPERVVITWFRLTFLCLVPVLG